MNKKHRNYLFLLLLMVVSFYYNYQEIIFKPTQSIHQWRQTDGASIALNYYMEGMHFFQPKTHNLTSDGGKSSFSATADTPLLYYSAALLYKLFGYHEFIFRLLNTLIFLCGLFYLFKALSIFLKDFIWSAAITMLGFTSIVLVYYANNFLPDSTALSMVFIGIFHFFSYIKKGKNRHMYLMLFFFFLAGSLKITALISFAAIGILFLLEWSSILSLDKDKIFKKPYTFIIASCFYMSLVFGWILYASHFNKIHESTYFSTTTFPIWKMDKSGILNVINGIKDNWLYAYYHSSIHLIIGISLAFVLIFFRKIPNIFKILLGTSLVLGIVFCFLQFALLKDHDYYIINLFIIPILIVTGAAIGLKENYPKIFHSNFLKAAMIVIILFNIFYTEKGLNERYEGQQNQRMLKANDFYDITPTLRKAGLDRNTRVISIPGGNHINLYLMDQKGWTEFTDQKLNRGKSVSYNRNRKGIFTSIEHGAEYLILENIDQLFQKKYLREFATHLTARHKNVLIFDLKNQESNFSLENRILKEKIICDAEKTDSVSEYFISENEKHYFSGIQNRTDEFSYSGKYSVKLKNKSEYGMSIEIDSLVQGESFSISVIKKGSKNKGSIEVTAKDRNDFYLHQNQTLKTAENKSGWDLMEIEFFIPLHMEGEKISIFLYNPSKEIVYFDDLRIHRYQTVL